MESFSRLNNPIWCVEIALVSLFSSEIDFILFRLLCEQSSSHHSTVLSVFCVFNDVVRQRHDNRQSKQWKQWLDTKYKREFVISTVSIHNARIQATNAPVHFSFSTSTVVKFLNIHNVVWCWVAQWKYLNYPWTKALVNMLYKLFTKFMIAWKLRTERTSKK